jgi:hypothetical protein
MIVEAFAPRYLVDTAQPARVLKVLLDGLSPADLRQMLFLYTCRATPVLADFVREVYWQKYTAGGREIAKDEARRFILRAVRRDLTARKWSDTTVTRMSTYLLGISADYGLLGSIRARSRPIVPFGITPLATSLLAHDLHFRGLTDQAVVHHADWSLFGLDAADVRQEMKRLALRGRMIVQSAGGVTRISWKCKTIEELAYVLSKG